ncbi:MAG: class II glutamine amidotransferase [Eubacteriales bacterium]|nr:class II glutamine amidotransferase [Eubacteriales bacterium]
MCELFGFSSQKKENITGYLEEFYSHSVQHPHGWGLVTFEGDQAFIEKQPVQATKSEYLKARLLDSVEAENAFGHIRYATIGHVDYDNCHPYTKKDANGRRWTLVHNGTIFCYPPLDMFINIQQGNTDSERILLYLVSLIDQTEQEAGRRLSAEERFRVIDTAVVDMAPDNKLNLMLFDGEQMYVHTNYKDSLYLLEKEGSTMFATVPLSEERWEPVPFAQLLAYQGGKQIFAGTKHGAEYIDSEENLRYLYQIFADL